MRPITIVMTTYFQPGPEGEARARLAFETFKSWIIFLTYDNLYLHVADDGSDAEHFNTFLDQVYDVARHFKTSWKAVTVSRQDRRGVGASLNQGMRVAWERDGYMLYLVDDWAANRAVDLTGPVRFLDHPGYEGWGCVRLGPPHPNLNARAVHLGDLGWAFTLDAGGYVAAQRPALWAKRFFDTFGEWKEDCSALECEKDMSDRWTEAIRSRAGEGIRVVYWLDAPFDHPEDETNLSAVDPREG